MEAGAHHQSSQTNVIGRGNHPTIEYNSRVLISTGRAALPASVDWSVFNAAIFVLAATEGRRVKVGFLGHASRLLINTFRHSVQETLLQVCPGLTFRQFSYRKA